MNNHGEVAGEGKSLLLPEFTTTGSCPRDLMKGGGCIHISKSAKEVIGRHSVLITTRKKRQLILMKGKDLNRDCCLPEITLLAKLQGWLHASVEDALSLPRIISADYLRGHDIKWIVVVHPPIRSKGGGYLLGLELSDNGMTMFAHSANPHHKWMARNGGFALLVP